MQIQEDIDHLTEAESETETEAEAEACQNASFLNFLEEAEVYQNASFLNFLEEAGEGVFSRFLFGDRFLLTGEGEGDLVKEAFNKI